MRDRYPCKRALRIHLQYDLQRDIKVDEGSEALEDTQNSPRFIEAAPVDGKAGNRGSEREESLRSNMRIQLKRQSVSVANAGIEMLSKFVKEEGGNLYGAELNTVSVKERRQPASLGL